MAATVTLSTTLLNVPCSASSGQVKVASTSGLTPGVRLYVDRELMSVVSLGVSPWVSVLRGVDGTTATPHASASTVTIGSADQFYASDPGGMPPDAVLVTPHINVRTGDMFRAQGDASGVGPRWWEKVTTTYSIGPLGIRTTEESPSSSE